MIHNDRVKGTELGAVTTVHTDVGVNEKGIRLRDRFTGSIGGANNPNALRRTGFGTNTSAGTTILFVANVYIR
jgi:hypothetical protein